MASLVSVPAFITDAIDPELLRTADKIEFTIEKGEEMTTSYQLTPVSGFDDDYFAEQHAKNKSYHQRPIEMSPGSIRMSRKGEYDISTIDADSGGEYSVTPSVGGRQWQEYSKREISETTPLSPFEERTITYQVEQGTSLLNPNAPIKVGPGSQVIKHETFEVDTSEETFNMPPKFILTRARSMSPPSLRKAVNFGSVAEITTREQEFYPFRDAHQGKPLPGDNEYGTWGRGLHDPERQWKLSNGQWVRVGGKKQRDGDHEPQIKKKEEEPLKKEPGSKDGRLGSPLDSSRDRRSQPVDSSNLDDSSKIRPRRDSNDDDDLNKGKIIKSAEPEPEKPDYNIDLGNLIKRYEPEPEPEPVKEEPPKRIVLEPVQQFVAEPRKPIERPAEVEEPPMDDPNLMWMKMGPAQYGPPFGSLRRRRAAEEEWVGPPCELCHKQIEERRCMLAENMKFHCWHFACSFCCKTLKPDDFLLAESDNKPYCLNCHKREFPQVSLVNLKLDVPDQPQQPIMVN